MIFTGLARLQHGLGNALREAWHRTPNARMNDDSHVIKNTLPRTSVHKLEL